MIKIKIAFLCSLLLLTACQTNVPAPDRDCPITPIDTHVQEEQCKWLKSMPQTEKVKQRMLAMNCGLFF